MGHDLDPHRDLAELATDLDDTYRAVAGRLENLCNQTAAVDTGRHLTLAVGYGGRQEIFDAFHQLPA